MNLRELRKLRTEEHIRSLGMEFNHGLPCIESEETVRLRSAREVAERITALAYTNLLAFDTVSKEWVEEEAAEYQIGDLFTEDEKKFIANPTPTKKLSETWKVEAIWTLLWSLGIVEELNFPDYLADLNDLEPGVYPVGSKCDPAQFIERNTKLRSATEILDANDLYYRCYWAYVDRRIRGEAMDILKSTKDFTHSTG